MNQKRILGNEQVEEGSHKGRWRQEDKDRYLPLSKYKFNWIRRECEETNKSKKEVTKEDEDRKMKTDIFLWANTSLIESEKDPRKQTSWRRKSQRKTKTGRRREILPLSKYKFNRIKKECEEANRRNKQVEEENHKSKSTL